MTLKTYNFLFCLQISEVQYKALPKSCKALNVDNSTKSSREVLKSISFGN